MLSQVSKQLQESLYHYIILKNIYIRDPSRYVLCVDPWNACFEVDLFFLCHNSQSRA
jgi:hypothetical protein